MGICEISILRIMLAYKQSEKGKIDTTPLITHQFPLSEIAETYRIFENKLGGVIKVAIV